MLEELKRTNTGATTGTTVIYDILNIDNEYFQLQEQIFTSYS
jgi:hypothetical protein